VSPLVDEINHLLEVLDKRLKRSRNALGDLAHSLKKPLTALQQLGHEKTLSNDPELQQAIMLQLESIQRLIRRILQRARLAGEGPVGSHFQPEQDISPLLNMLRSMYHHKALDIESHIEPGIHIAADREDMLELIGNLLDNACKWARHRVRFSIQQDHGIKISVEDDGLGVSEDQLSRLTQRGQRLDEQTEGHGLGLSISRDIVDSLDGKLQLQRSEQMGGLLVTIQLPG
jgi:signal transduction histidine kinase